MGLFSGYTALFPGYLGLFWYDVPVCGQWVVLAWAPTSCTPCLQIARPLCMCMCVIFSRGNAPMCARVRIYMLLHHTYDRVVSVCVMFTSSQIIRMSISQVCVCVIFTYSNAPIYIQTLTHTDKMQSQIDAYKRKRWCRCRRRFWHTDTDRNTNGHRHMILTFTLTQTLTQTQTLTLTQTLTQTMTQSQTQTQT